MTDPTIDEIARRLADRSPRLTRDEARRLVADVLAAVGELAGLWDDRGHHSALRARRLDRYDRIINRATALAEQAAGGGAEG